MARIGLEHDRTWFVRLMEWGSRRKYGKVPDPGKVALHNRRVLTTMLLTEGSAARWNSLDPTLKALTVTVVSARIGCSWCMDFGYWEFHHQGVDPVKLRGVPGWRDSDVYTDLERAVMDYAEAVTATPPEVTDEQVERLRRDLTDEQLVELTATASLENYRSRINAALGLTSQGFKEYCELEAGVTIEDQLAREFDEHRAILVGAAYRVVGSVSDAEDVVQEAWLRWAAVDHEEVREPRAYLIRITTRLALNRLREQKARREQYVGPWLPEPIAPELASTDDPAAAVELADSVSMAMLVVLETLSPLERATFVLREVFDLPYDEIADTLGRSGSAVRQLAHRAREHVHARQPRHHVDKARHDEVTMRFMAAAGSGDFDQVVSLLAPDAVLISDGGGKKKAALRPIQGPDKIARWLFAVIAQNPTFEIRTAKLNDETAFIAYDGDQPDTVAFLETTDGLITGLYLIRNPDKLTTIPPRQALD